MSAIHNEILLEEERVEQDDVSLLTNLDYMMEFTKIVGALKQGCDVIQLPNGDSIVSQTKVVHTHFKWDRIKRKFAKVYTKS
jgi:hypothetical protein